MVVVSEGAFWRICKSGLVLLSAIPPAFRLFSRLIYMEERRTRSAGVESWMTGEPEMTVETRR